MNSKLTKTGQIVQLINSITKQGIDLAPLDPKQSQDFFYSLAKYINDEGAFNAHIHKNKITIETFFYDPLLSIELDGTTVQCIPINDSGWIDPVMVVLKFINFLHSKKKKKPPADPNEFNWL